MGPWRRPVTTQFPSKLLTVITAKEAATVNLTTSRLMAYSPGDCDIV